MEQLSQEEAMRAEQFAGSGDIIKALNNPIISERLPI